MLPKGSLASKRNEAEHLEQVAFMAWCDLQRRKYPELELFFAIANGGHRSVATAGKLKAEGVKAGIPDLHLPVSRGAYHSLFIEMKAGKNRTSAAQDAMIAKLQQAGNYCAVCYGAQEAIAVTLDYLEGRL